MVDMDLFYKTLFGLKGVDDSTDGETRQEIGMSLLACIDEIVKLVCLEQIMRGNWCGSATTDDIVSWAVDIGLVKDETSFRHLVDYNNSSQFVLGVFSDFMYDSLLDIAKNIPSCDLQSIGMKGKILGVARCFFDCIRYNDEIVCDRYITDCMADMVGELLDYADDDLDIDVDILQDRLYDAEGDYMEDEDWGMFFSKLCEIFFCACSEVGIDGK